MTETETTERPLPTHACRRCGEVAWRRSKSTSKPFYCGGPCHAERRARYDARLAAARRATPAAERHTQAQWLALVAQHASCPACHRPWGAIEPRLDGVVITKDHVIPVSRGGSDSIANLQPLCYRCNSAKVDLCSVAA